MRIPSIFTRVGKHLGIVRPPAQFNEAAWMNAMQNKPMEQQPSRGGLFGGLATLLRQAGKISGIDNPRGPLDEVAWLNAMQNKMPMDAQLGILPPDMRHGGGFGQGYGGGMAPRLGKLRDEGFTKTK